MVHLLGRARKWRAKLRPTSTHEIPAAYAGISRYTWCVFVHRNHAIAEVRRSIAEVPVTVLTGPRQSGKTTLAREFLHEDSPNYFDLEDPTSLARLDEPMTALGGLSGLVVIDEVQRRPELFPVLRVLVDRREQHTQFLVLGSASGDLFRQSSESLVGRTRTIEIGGFNLSEVGADSSQRLWLRGGMPRSFLASSDRVSRDWRREFVRTLLERDLPQWGVRVAATALHRFWSNLAHRHAQLWNAAEVGRALGVDATTARRHLDLLTDALVIRQLNPWHANIGKRQVKAPKVYVRDSGILHHLLGVGSEEVLLKSTNVGASWEGFVIEQLLATHDHDEAWFWSVHQGPELDLLLRRGTELHGIEIKRTDAPRMTASLRTAISDLGPTSVSIVYPGSRKYELGEHVMAVPLTDLATRNSLFN